MPRAAGARTFARRGAWTLPYLLTSWREREREKERERLCLKAKEMAHIADRSKLIISMVYLRVCRYRYDICIYVFVYCVDLYMYRHVYM